MDETRLAEIKAVTNDLINRRAQADYDEAAWDAEISLDTVLELIDALREAWLSGGYNEWAWQKNQDLFRDALDGD